MKKVVSILSALFILFSLSGCTYEDPVISALPDYESRVFFTSGGFQDYTDYAVCTYHAVSAEDLQRTGYFREVNADDLAEILAHIEDFEKWVAVIGSELEANYDFDKTVLSKGDYFYIETKYGQPIGGGTYGKFDDYFVYLFDVEAQVLYYFHSNI